MKTVRSLYVTRDLHRPENRRGCQEKMPISSLQSTDAFKYVCYIHNNKSADFRTWMWMWWRRWSSRKKPVLDILKEISGRDLFLTLNAFSVHSVKHKIATQRKVKLHGLQTLNISNINSSDWVT